MNWKSIIIIALFAFAFIASTECHKTNERHSPAEHCKELNDVNCYMNKNRGQYCNKEKAETFTRWFYDKGVCRPYDYKGCYGNRNRFCTKQACEARCK